jgi:hypothetical protein
LRGWNGTFLSFTKSKEQEGRTGPIWGPGGVGTSEEVKCGKRVWRMYIVQIRVHMYVDGKRRPVGTIPGIGEGRIRENDGVGEFKYDTFDIW